MPTTQLSSFYDDDDDDDHDHDHYHDEDDDDDGGHEDHDHNKMALKATSICLLTTQLHFMKLSKIIMFHHQHLFSVEHVLVYLRFLGPKKTKTCQ